MPKADPPLGSAQDTPRTPAFVLLDFLDIEGLPFAAQLVVALLALCGLWIGSDFAIRAARRLARALGISELVIGLTLVSIASSLPEIFVNISAGNRGADDVAIGNVVGSCFVQITLIVGLVALFSGALKGARRDLYRDGSILLLSNAAVLFLGLDGNIGTLEAVGLTVTYGAYVCYLLLFSSQGGAPYQQAGTPHVKARASRIDTALLSAVNILVSVAVVWLSAEGLISAGLSIGRSLDVSPAVIGLWSGFGTSTPELFISLVATFRGAGGLSVGNLVGSNITDPLFSLGLGVLVTGPYAVSDYMLYTALPVWLAATAFAVVVFWIWGRIGRLPALLLIAYYFFGYFFLLN